MSRNPEVQNLYTPVVYKENIFPVVFDECFMLLIYKNETA